MATEESVVEPVAEEPQPVAEPEDEWQDVLGSGQLLRKIIKKSDDEIKPLRGFICRLNITGRLKCGKIIEEKKDFEINACDGDVIQGIDLVVPLMHEGEISEIKMTSRFGYGDIGMPPDVPAGADLIYTVELINFEPEIELETLSVEERRSTGNKKRERGNWWYSMQEPILAVQCYKKAIEYLDEASGGISDPTPDGEMEETSKELYALIDDRMKAYNNMAAAQIKQGAYDAALSSVDTVLTLQPKNVKALFRRGKILSHKNNIADALKSVRAAYEISPDDRAIKAELIRLEERMKRDSQKEKDLARKMLGGNSDGSKKKSEKDRSKKSGGKKMLVWSSVAFSVAVGVISIAVYKYKLI